MDSNYKKNIFLEFNCSHNLQEINSVNWSIDNCISFITDKGVYIFNCDLDFLDSSKSIFSYKQFISNPKESFRDYIDIDMNKIKSDSSHRNHQFVLDYNEILVNLHYDQVCLKYKLAKWSPFTKQFGCFLSLLTYDHQLIVYCYHSNDWREIKNVTKLLLAQLKYVFSFKLSN